MVNERMFINHNYLKVTETKHTKEETIMNRIKRGMVFSFDSSKSIGTDKYNALVKSADGKLMKNALVCGERPHVVISSDEVNDLGYVCTLIPFKSENNAADELLGNPRIQIYGPSTLVSQNAITVNQVEIGNSAYMGMLNEKDMRVIDLMIARRYFNGVVDVVYEGEAKVEQPKVVEKPFVDELPNAKSPEDANAPKTLDEFIAGAITVSNPEPTINKAVTRGVVDNFKGGAFKDRLQEMELPDLEKFIKDSQRDDLTVAQLYTRNNIPTTTNSCWVGDKIAEKYNKLTNKRKVVRVGTCIIFKPTNAELTQVTIDRVTISLKEMCHKYKLSRKYVNSLIKYSDKQKN